MAEVIAGCERTFAVWKGKTKSCGERVRGLELRVVELTDLGTSLNRWQWLGPLLAGGLAFILGGALGLALGFGLRLGVVSP